MKRILGCLVAVIMVLSACQGPMGPQGRDGRDGKDGHSTEWYYVDFRIKGADWLRAGQPDEIGSYYYYVFDAPEITQAIYDDGLILCAYRYVDDTGVDVQSYLPYTEYFIDTDQHGKNENRFAMYISFSVTPTVGRYPGTIEFRVTFSDFYTGKKGPPASCWFRLTLVY